jgi:hypothetical protein
MTEEESLSKFEKKFGDEPPKPMVEAGSLFSAMADRQIVYHAHWEGWQAAVEACSADHAPIYSPENSNYYCSKCKHGMGNAYFAVAQALKAAEAREERLTKSLQEICRKGEMYAIPELQEMVDKALCAPATASGLRWHKATIEECCKIIWDSDFGHKAKEVVVDEILKGFAAAEASAPAQESKASPL